MYIGIKRSSYAYIYVYMQKYSAMQSDATYLSIVVYILVLVLDQQNHLDHLVLHRLLPLRHHHPHILLHHLQIHLDLQQIQILMLHQ